MNWEKRHKERGSRERGSETEWERVLVLFWHISSRIGRGVHVRPLSEWKLTNLRSSHYNHACRCLSIELGSCKRQCMWHVYCYVCGSPFNKSGYGTLYSEISVTINNKGCSCIYHAHRIHWLEAGINDVMHVHYAELEIDIPVWTSQAEFH